MVELAPIELPIPQKLRQLGDIVGDAPGVIGGGSVWNKRQRPSWRTRGRCLRRSRTLARANPHCRDVSAGNEVLMIFQGPQGYITPNWYPSKAEHGKVVPTWNYAAVHAYGQPEAIEDANWLRRHVTELTAQQERGQARPWTPSDSPEAFIDSMLRAIIGFRFVIKRLEGKWKMSQNRGMHDREGVARGLRNRGLGDDLEIAAIVTGELTPSNT